MQQMRLATSSEALAVRLLMQGTAMAAEKNTTTTTTTAPLSARMEARPLITPRSLENNTNTNAAALKLTSHVVVEDGMDAAEYSIPAVHAVTTTTTDPTEMQTQSEGVVEQERKNQPQPQRSLVFRPIRKAMGKAIKSKKALVEVDVSPVVPRLSLDALPTATSTVSSSMVPM